MTDEEYHQAIVQFFEEVTNRLFAKNKAYRGDGGVFNGFDRAGDILNTTPHKALAGMLVKHTHSIYDMLESDSTTRFDPAVWDEKIGDHIAYLLILRAMVVANENAITVENDN